MSEIRFMTYIEDTETSAVGGCLAAITILPILIVVSYILNAWAISTLWGWFVVPLGVSAIGYMHALGLLFLWRYLCPDQIDDYLKRESTSSEKLFKALGQLILQPIVTVGFAWLFINYWHYLPACVQ